MSTAADLRRRIDKRADELAHHEAERRETSAQLRQHLAASADATGRRQAAGKQPKPMPKPRRGRLIMAVVATALVAALISVGISVVSMERVVLLSSDGVCTLSALLGDSITSRAMSEYREDFEYHTPEHNQSLFWGTYRPHLLAGVRTRESRSLLVGIAWYDEGKMFPLRHTAEEGEDVTFRWEAHDGRWYGREVITDRQNGLHVTVRFLKAPEGNEWRMQIDGYRTRSTRPLRFIVYFASEHRPADAHEPLLTAESLHPEASSVANEGLVAGAFTTQPSIRLRGSLQNGIKFTAVVSDDLGRLASANQWEAFAWPFNPDQWKMDLVSGGRRLQNHRQYLKPAAMQGAISFRKRVTSDFRLSVHLFEDGAASILADRCVFHSLAMRRESAFEEAFETRFGLTKHVDALPATVNVPKTVLMQMARSGLSGLLGGIGYWHGDYRVQLDERTVVTMPPGTLFSGVPSRAKFPRGFLWDEGFHQLLVAKWDPALSKDIILHWIDGDVLDRTTGWIPREQILGAEPRTRVPDQFVPQHPDHANPPAMILQVENFAMTSRDPANDPFLLRARRAVRRWLGYFMKSQCGGSKNCSTAPLQTENASFLFRWRSRNNYHLLASGLDDYPRPHCNPSWKELHVDLYCWAAMMASTVNRIEQNGGGDATSATDAKLPTDEEWRKHLRAIHWDQTRKHYSDITGCSSDPASPKRFSKFFGYVNLFPLLTMLEDDRDVAAALLRKTRTELSSGYGLQSVSNATRKFLTQHDDYWTGPIWLPINYLMLRALHKKYIALVGAEAEQLYADLRADLVRNVGSEFGRTGKLWENYDFVTGRGRSTSPFNGWTTLIIAILTEQY
jgi:mannosyl-oligosaccharide glucosidase